MDIDTESTIECHCSHCGRLFRGSVAVCPETRDEPILPGFQLRAVPPGATSDSLIDWCSSHRSFRGFVFDLPNGKRVIAVSPWLFYDDVTGLVEATNVMPEIQGAHFRAIPATAVRFLRERGPE